MSLPHYHAETDLNAENLLRLPAEFGCPVWVYDAHIIRRQIAALQQLTSCVCAKSLFEHSYPALNARAGR